MQHPAGARSPDLGMARQVSDVALVDARVMDPLAPASGGPGLRRPRRSRRSRRRRVSVGRLPTSFARHFARRSG